ncbi:nodulin-related protein 1-like isoform X1 [Ipomoea triloba]|uniref:nodulin-related protein 1-like isoform X1 n=1 Tax=Ipomoea triloba TaxID=35885 RepID=UPI00125DA62D|nr:nodulin-related protein 1-like isoform X1 [Ipomoea triloba]
MDFLKKALDGGHDSDQKPSDHSGHSNSDLFSSAKVVAEAAQAQFQNKNSDINKGEVAGAAANLLDAAQKYGKLDETKGVGQYVEKAEGYLRGYGQSAGAAVGGAVEKAEGVGHSAGEAVKGHVEKAEGMGHSAGEAVKGHVEKAEGIGHSAGEAVGEYAKQGEEFLKKQSSGEGNGGAGDFMKAAGGFLKRD